MTFDTEYDLELFRAEQKELFDETGKRYTGVSLSNRQAEMMLSLINSLEKELLIISKGDIKEITNKEQRKMYDGFIEKYY